MEQQLNLNNKQNHAIRIVIALAGLACFAFIAWKVMNNQTVAFDNAVDNFAYGTRSPLTKALLIPITYIGNWQLIVVLVAVLLVIPTTRSRIGLPMAVTAACSVLIYKGLKLIFLRPRPDVSLHLITQGGYSFPSGHSLNGIVCYGILIYLIRTNCRNRKAANILTVLLTALIILIGWSRIFCGVHYVTDVLGGWSMGIAILMAATIIIDKINVKLGA